MSLARGGTAAHIEKVVRGCRRYEPKDERERNASILDSRYVQISHDEDGMLILRVRLDPVAGAAIERTLEAAMEALHDKNRHSACRDTPAHDLMITQRRADALVLLAESALAGGLDQGTAGDRYQVVLHVDAEVLADPAEVGVSALENGQHVSAETSRRVSCDAATVVITHGSDGSILDVGRKTRTISPALRRALTDRDRGCRFHHRLVHEEGFQVKRLPGGDVEFRNPHGLLVPRSPEPPRRSRLVASRRLRSLRLRLHP